MPDLRRGRENGVHRPGYQEPSRFDLGACDACNTGFVLDTAVDTRPIYEAIYAAAEVVPGYNRYVRYARDILAVDDPLGWLAAQEVSYWGIRQHVSMPIEIAHFC